MGRTTKGLIVSVNADDGIKKTPPSDVDYGLIIYTPSLVIIVGQVNLATQQTWTPEANTMEIVEPDELDAYIDSMLANGWTIAPDVRNDEGES
tara:strand:- start:4167 stop:4445 length:279 start_codon:yes stop_codon:yes gene_type:complete